MMNLRNRLLGLAAISTAAGGPYMLMETETGRYAARLFNGSSETSHLTDYQSDPLDSGFWNANGVDLSGAADAEPDSKTPPRIMIHALQEVLRFDVSPAWVMQRFPQVTTVLSEMQLDGLRTPLITGTTPNDMAGTLTYYFDAYQRVQRIQVHAVSGDPSRFVAELQHAYQLQQQPSLGGNLYLKKWNGQPVSLVYLAPAPIIRADSPYARYNVLIELNQAGLQYGISPQAEQLLEAGRHSQRWQ